MAPRGTALLCLVLCLGQRSQAQEGAFPKPRISAVPGSVIALNETVKILCWGIPEAYLFQLEIWGNSEYRVVAKTLGIQDGVFTITHRNISSAGTYSCRYRRGFKWSELSEGLELVVTGLYHQPSLSANQSPKVMLGENVTLHCVSAQSPFDKFSLTKEGGANLPQHQNGGHQAAFTLGPVNSSFSGSYRCYGWYNSSPYVWSAPSDALEIVVADPTDQDYTTENLIRMGAAGLVLVVLLAILAGEWHSCRVPHKGEYTTESQLSKSRGNWLWTLPTISCVSLWPAGLGPHPAAHHRPGRISAMPSTLAALLCLGLCLSQRISTQEQTLLKPTIWAKPSSIISKGRPVAIWCQGTHEAVEYSLYFEGGLFASKKPKPTGMKNRVKFSILTMVLHTAGQYVCSYQNGELWSEPSDPLDLIMTGMYDTPTLSVHPSPEVVSGENVTFHCQIETGTSTFFLLKEERPRHPQRRYRNIQGEFPIGPVTTAHSGTYRCFGSYNNYAWSSPSEPVKLLVTGEIGDTSPAPTEPTTSPGDTWDLYPSATKTGFQKDLALWDHTAQNLVRLGLAALVLVALVWLLVEDRLSRKRTWEGPSRASGWERRRFRTQRSFNKDQES
ncbi:natural cytotoxicity triggering receptor 1 [Dasypus novemcinctus]|uniref:natural cytotoxicity triggering receptor 1 n=1 Tax=Dasypus novemcinctus TaxID=9361 RepID=UPI00265F7BF8|nr:natural cytotoxicity triggering receptor 1 [Dasypus novemcinctus]